jgi:hypothetical protein
MGAPEGFERKEILYRIGTFFLLVGIGFLVFFLLSEAARQVTFGYFCGSLVLFIVGFIFRAQARRPINPSGRFSLVRRLMPKSKQNQGQKK